MQELFNQIQKTKKENFFCIVEGKKDMQALRKIGFSIKNIFVLNNGKSLQENIEKIINITKGRKVCILTDLDERGRKLYKAIARELSKQGIKLENGLRLQMIKENLSHLEGIPHFLKRRFL
ncbi:MAG: toprim domain-containing protein [Candidatus Pacearchaeota archaeon]|nr:toprim domain-containing protein [Candidatus Pacearchaeota archaeon]